jgi:hypothetical protein
MMEKTNENKSDSDNRSSAATQKDKLVRLIALFDSFAYVMRIIRRLILAFIALYFFTIWFSNFNDIDNYPIIQKVTHIGESVNNYFLTEMRNFLPTTFEGKKIADWKLLLSGSIALYIFFGIIGGRFSRKAELLRDKSAELAKPNSGAMGSHTLVNLKRNELLKIYADAKKTLEDHKQELAFLSIDVVDSTGMKVGEETVMAELDFSQYKGFVVAIINKNKALKSTWTPDGVMICFENVKDTVKAAQEIIIGLKEFNQKIKVIKRDFRIRAGINSGVVYSDATTPMEEMTDRVIDIAGHMQKYGCVDGISISKHAIEPLLEEFDFVDASRLVDDCPVYEWKPKV